MTTATYHIQGMHCAGCEGKIRQKVAALPGVTSAQAHAASGTLTVAADIPLDRKTLATAVSTAGDYTLGDLVAAPATEFGTLERGQPLEPPATAAKGARWTISRGYRSLGILVAYILGASLMAELPRPTLDGVMANFMGGFFLAFSFFKFLDLKGFADGFARYDLLAERWKPWGYLYAFVELGLGIAFLTRAWPVATNTLTVVLMLFGSVGVIRSLLRKDRIKCACLGTVIDLPLGTVTLIEDLGMALMAGGMLVMMAR